MHSKIDTREATVQYFYAILAQNEIASKSIDLHLVELLCERKKLALLTAIKRLIDSASYRSLDRFETFLELCSDRLSISIIANQIEDDKTFFSGLKKSYSEWIDSLIRFRKINISDVENQNIILQLDSSLVKIEEKTTILQKKLIYLSDKISKNNFYSSSEKKLISLAEKEKKVCENIFKVINSNIDDNIDDYNKVYRLKIEYAEFKSDLIRNIHQVIEVKERLKDKIEAVVTNYKFPRIHFSDMAILLQFGSELITNKGERAPAIINEAIDLAQKFGSNDSGRFVNGILDQIAKERVEAQA
jgi:N utilization substance protein B